MVARIRRHYLLPDWKWPGFDHSYAIADFLQIHLHQAVGLRLQALVLFDALAKLGYVLSDSVNLLLCLLFDDEQLLGEEFDQFWGEAFQIVEVEDVHCELDVLCMGAIDRVHCQRQGVTQVLQITSVVLSHLVDQLVFLFNSALETFDRFL